MVVCAFFNDGTGFAAEIDLAPMPPRWVFEPWVWDDNPRTESHQGHRAGGVLDLVAGYRSRNLPVGVVIIDSPWETNFNTFLFEPSAFPDPQGLIDSLHAQNIRVLLWITNILNDHSDPVYYEDWFQGGKSGNFDEAFANNYLIENGKIYKWWWGFGCFLDHTNPAAVNWWAGEMQKALALGIDGWKVDASTRKFPAYANCYAGRISKRGFSWLYYRDFFEITRDATGGKGIVFAKTYDELRGDSTYVPLEYAQAVWVGDQGHAWSDADGGLENALINMQLSAARGFIAIGSEIGGFSPYEYGKVQLIDRQLFIRWIQLGALSPIMENGGCDEHRPWKYDDVVFNVYNYFAHLHHALVPYLYSEAWRCAQSGGALIRPIEGSRYQYLLGPDILVAPIYTSINERTVFFPHGSDWIDFWHPDQIFPGGTKLDRYMVDIEKYPIFIRRGAILPLQVDSDVNGFGSELSAGHRTLLIYPGTFSQYSQIEEDGYSTQISCSNDEQGFRVNIMPAAGGYILKTLLDNGHNTAALNDLALAKVATWVEFTAAESAWFHDADGFVWFKFAGDGGEAVLRAFSVVPVEWGDIRAHAFEDGVVISWSTLSESANLGFELQRRMAKGDWLKVGFIPGHGTSQHLHHYQYKDSAAHAGRLCYRLRQMDYDGSCSYSAEISVEALPPVRFDLESLHPNPFATLTRGAVRLPLEQFVQVQIVNCLGQRVRTLLQGALPAGRHDYFWDGCDQSGRNLPDGVYFLTAGSGGQTALRKVIKMGRALER